MAPQKGKEGTKGQKQIDIENQESFKFNNLIGLVGLAVSGLATYLHDYGYTLPLFGLFVHLVIYWMLSAMIKSGLDINVATGTAEQMKDVLYITVLCEIISLFTLYGWWLWIIIPLVGLVKLWSNFLAPWFFQAPSPEEDERADKKKMKMEKKIRRIQSQGGYVQQR